MRNYPTDPTTRVVNLTEALRAWLRARRESPEVLASAMTYELTALVALHADTVTEACTLLDTWLVDMKRQVHQFGVGVDHP